MHLIESFTDCNTAFFQFDLHQWEAVDQNSDIVAVGLGSGLFDLLKLFANFNSSWMSLNQTMLGSEGETTAYDLRNNNLYINSSWQTLLGKNWVYRTGISATENRDDVKYANAKYKETLRGLHFKHVFTHQLSDKINLRLGADLFAKEYISDFTENAEKFLHSFKDNSMATFAETEIYLSNKFVARTGGRLEHSVYMKKANFSPRISTAWKLDDFSQFSLAYGWFYQDPLDDYLIYTDFIAPERADHYILTFQSVKNKRTLRSEVYYKQYKDLVKVQREEFYLPQAYSNSGEGYAYGLDVFWRDNTTFRNGEYWISYGYTSTERDFRDYPYAAIPSFTSKHNLSVVYKYWFDGIRSLFGFSYRFASPRVFHDPNLQGFNNRKTIPYQSLDFNITYLHRENIIFYAAITNIAGFNQEYGERFAIEADADGRYASEPIIPGSNRFFVLACFITLSKRGDLNQLDKIE